MNIKVEVELNDMQLNCRPINTPVPQKKQSRVFCRYRRYFTYNILDFSNNTKNCISCSERLHVGKTEYTCGNCVEVKPKSLCPTTTSLNEFG